ncbi:MAG: DUF5058 family protein [Ruminococcaceae bacterium]|nr:DUF5058 family protein [Oscillospiraceae bacterium]
MIQFFHNKKRGDDMDFKSDGFMYMLGFGVVAFILFQSIFFIVRAWKRAKELGISTSSLKKTVVSSALFTVAPALAIVATVLTLSGALGTVLPWIRLTVIGAISYEVPAATSAIEAFGGTGGLSAEITDPTVFATIAWVMTLGSILPLFLIPFLLKKIQSKVGKVASNNQKWADTMAAAAFIGLIAAFIGKAVMGKGDKAVKGDGAGVLSLVTLISSMLYMLIFQLIVKKGNIKWLEPFAMPLSMILAMGTAVLAAQLLPESVAYFEWRG